MSSFQQGVAIGLAAGYLLVLVFLVGWYLGQAWLLRDETRRADGQRALDLGVEASKVVQFRSRTPW